MSIDKELLLHSVRIKSDLLAPVGNQEFYKKVTDNVSLFDSEEYTTAQQIAMFKGKTIPFKLLSTTESIEKYTLKNCKNSNLDGKFSSVFHYQKWNINIKS